MSTPARRFTPTHWVNHLTAFDTCPQKYFLKHVRKRKGRVFVRPEMTRGRITHEVLAHAFKVFAGRRAFPANLRAEIETRVAETDDINGTLQSREVELIHDWVDCAVETFDARKSVHTVERSFTYSYPGKGVDAPFATRARVDLVLRLDEGEVEHIDWKTGKRHAMDELQTVAARIAVGRALGVPQVRSTTTYLGTGESNSRMLSRDEARRTWDHIRAIARDIDANHASGEWAPVQNPLCPYCEYYQAGCRLYQRIGTDPLKDDA
jgi:RecB family exonuclease